MSEEINLYSLIFLIISGTVLSALAVNLVLIQYGITNDYVLYNLQEISEDFEDQGLYTNTINISNMTLTISEAYQDTITWFDNIWFLVYILFVMGTFIIAYTIKKPTEINFFMILLYGIFIFLFVGYLMDIFVSWFINNVTLALMPNSLEYFPKFSWFADNAGVINFFHAMVLLIISRVNFQFGLSQSINRQELESLDDEEIN